MTKDEINRFIAEKVMGWEFVREETYFRPEGKFDTERAYVHNWNPMENIAQAFEVLEKFDRWSLDKHGDTYFCTIVPNINQITREAGGIPKEAICLSAIAADGK